MSVQKPSFFKIAFFSGLAAIGLASRSTADAPTIESNFNTVAASAPNEEIAKTYDVSIEKVKRVAKQLGITESRLKKVIDKNYDEILTKIKSQFEKTGSLIRKPNQAQLRDMLVVINRVFLEDLPYDIDAIEAGLAPEGVENIFSVFRDSRSDCDTRSILTKAILHDLSIENDLVIACFPRHANLFLPTSSKTLGAPYFVEMNNDGGDIFCDLTSYYGLLGSEEFKDFRIETLPYADDHIMLTFFRDKKLTIDERLKAYESLVKLPRSLISITGDKKDRTLAPWAKQKLIVLQEAVLGDNKVAQVLDNELDSILEDSGHDIEIINIHLKFLLKEKKYQKGIDFIKDNFESFDPLENTRAFREIKQNYVLALKALNIKKEEFVDAMKVFPDSENFIIFGSLDYYQDLVAEMDISEQRRKTNALERYKDSLIGYHDLKQKFGAGLVEAESDDLVDYLNLVRLNKASAKNFLDSSFVNNTFEDNLLLLNIYHYSGDTARKTEIIDYFEDNYPRDINFLIAKIQLATSQQECIEEMENMIRIYPARLDLMRHLAVFYEESADFDKALKMNEALRDYHPDCCLNKSLEFMKRHPDRFSQQDIDTEKKYLQTNYPNLSSFR